MDAIIITGANGNIASVIARMLLTGGKHVLLVYNEHRHRLDDLLRVYPQQAAVMQGNVKLFNSLHPALSQNLQSRNWYPKALIHTAAVRSTDHSAVHKSDPILWREVIETNVLGTYNVLKATVKCFHSTAQNSKQPESDPFFRIVLLGSDVSRIGLPFGSAYAASKAAVSNISRSVSVELGKDKVLINTISPGPVKMEDSHFSKDYREFREKYYEEMMQRIPLKRIAKPEDVANLALHLISEDNRYITGEEFFITGGKI